MKNIALVFIGSLLYLGANSQAKKPLPVIDMHLHALHANDQGPAPVKIGAPFTNWGWHDPRMPYINTVMQVFKTGEWSGVNLTSPTTDDSLQTLTIAALNKLNVYGVISGNIDVVRKWKAAEPSRIINGVMWSFEAVSSMGLTIDSLKKLFRSGEFKVFGEIALQYEGYSPSDTLFEPYFAMAEQLDIPVAVHIGPGPPGAPYFAAPNYRAKLHSALVLEELLTRHPKLRVYAMHAGWPMLDDMMAMLYTHPQLNVDVGIISYAMPVKEFYFYLERLVNAGFGKRIMFGSDNMVWPGSIAVAIRHIEDAPFLSAAQKRDILFNNTAKFLRLNDIEIKAMQ